MYLHTIIYAYKFAYYRIYVLNCSDMSDFAAPWTVTHQVHGDSPGKNTGVGCHALLRGILPTQVFHIVGGFFSI